MYRCKNCYHGVDEENLNSIFQCPVCGVEREMFEEIKKEDSFKGIPIAKNNPAIRRIDEKCINCGRCNYICENIVGVKYNKETLEEPICLNCGICGLNCPMGAIVPQYEYKQIFELIKDPTKIVVVSVSPAVRVSLGEEFGMEAGTYVEGKIVTSLKQLGIDYVFDTTFGADLTAMEEATELLERINQKKNLPQFSSCCPSWVKYLEIYHPEYLNHLSTCKSPIAMQGSIIKTYLAQKRQLDVKNIVHIALTPCTAKKYEIKRLEHNASAKFNNIDYLRDTDYVITASELAIMLREKDIDFANLTDQNFDNLLNKGSQAGISFGHSSGVTKSVLKTLYYNVTNHDLTDKEIDLKESSNGIKEIQIKLANQEIKIAIVQGLVQVEEIIKQFDKYKKYDFIEVMNCQGGCIGGGGQPLVPINKQDQTIEQRKNKLEHTNENIDIKYPYQNPDIQTIYREFLEKPASQLSKKLLHTNYKDRSYLLKNHIVEKIES